MIYKRTLLVALLTITGLVVETSILGEATLGGTKPQLLLLMTVALAMGEGPALGAGFGFTAGLATDLLTGLPAGLTAITYTIVGYAVGRTRAQVQTPTAWLPAAMEFAATLGGVLLYGGISLLVGQEATGGSALVVHALLAACYSALLTPFLYPLVRGL
ncbi:MAG: rod shape-determining protein MreD, partial [Actinobacteria bacterium]